MQKEDYPNFKFWKKAGFYLLMVHLLMLVPDFVSAGVAQVKSLEETFITLNLRNASLKEALKQIEKQTDYKFAFDNRIERKVPDITIVQVNASVKKILIEISRQAHVSFRRVNNDIDVKITEPQSKPHITEITQALRSIKGTITDEKGQTLPGATVIVKGTTIGTITDVDGKFSLEVPEDAKALIVSFVGYKSEEVAIEGRSVINVGLEVNTATLEEIVVVGYGEVEMRDLTGSVAQVKAEELQTIPVYNMEQALKARAAGVRVTQNSGQPGGRIEVRIRGGNSMLGDNQPLYVVDGFPITGGINFLNPADIESIDILKDASATAIYGARGANGVVIITSKRGKAGQKNSISFSSSYGIQEETNRYDLLNAKQYAQIANAYLINEGQQPYFDLEEVQNPGTDWQDAVLRSAPIQNHTLSFSGSSQKTRYALSGNYYGQEGILINTGVKRGSMRLNLDHEFNDALKLGVNVNLSRRKQESVPVNNGYRGGGSVLSAAAAAPPTLPVYDENGLPTQIEKFYSFGSADMRNPMIYAGHQTATLGNTVVGNTFLEIQLMKGLSFKTLLGMEYAQSLSDYYEPVLYESDRGAARQENNYRSSFLNENVLTYSPKLGADHNLSVMAGYTYQTANSRYNGIYVSGFSNNTTRNYDLSAAETVGIPWSGISEWVLASWLARANYSLKDRYLFTFSFRADGSSRFGENNKWAMFPSAAFAWRVSDEAFMEAIPFIHNLKLRTSYGVTGNTALAPYQSLDRMESVQTIYGNNQPVVGYTPSGISNPELKWEMTRQMDLGLDLGLMENRVRLTVDYYKKTTTDLLASVPLPPSVGFSSILQNVGEIENQGIELTLGADILNTNQLSWTVTGSFSSNQNKVTKLAGGSDILSAGQAAVWSSTNIAREGEPLGSFYGYLEDGLDENGLIKYKDVVEDGEINAQDRVILGNPNPDFYYGLNSDVTFRNFELNIFLEGVYGNQIFNATNGTHLNSFQRGTNQFQDLVGNYWTPESANPDSKYPRIGSSAAFDVSDRFIEDGSYLRVKSIRLAYNLPLEKWGISWLDFAQFYVSGINLFTFTDYTGLDPEVNTRGDDSSQDVTTRLQMGHDQSGYPNAKTYLAGIKLSF